MTRKIHTAIVNAIKAGTTLSRQNTLITVNTREDGARITSVYLHGNLIAQNGKDGQWVFKFAGWLTPTTRDRINAVREAVGLPSVSIRKGCAVTGGTASVLVDAHSWFHV